MSSINEFVMRGGQSITAGKAQAFRQQLPFVQVKAETLPTDQFPALPEQVKFLARYVEDVLDNVHDSADFLAVGESIFALSYVLKETDIIPDSVPGAGLCDDASVIRSVLGSHEAEFQAYAERIGVDFATLAVA